MTRGADLERVLREGKRARTEHLEVRVLASLLRHVRVGIVVPRYGRSAVERNRLKRRLRDIVRTQLLPVIPAGLDIVVRAGPASYEIPYVGLRRDIAHAMGKLLDCWRAP